MQRKGEVHRRESPRTKYIKLGILSAGQFFGHEDILEDLPFRSNSVHVKTTDTCLYRIDKTRFIKILACFPFIRKIIEDNKDKNQKWRHRFKGFLQKQHVDRLHCE